MSNERTMLLAYLGDAAALAVVRGDVPGAASSEDPAKWAAGLAPLVEALLKRECPDGERLDPARYSQKTHALCRTCRCTGKVTDQDSILRLALAVSKIVKQQYIPCSGLDGGLIETGLIDAAMESCSAFIDNPTQGRLKTLLAQTLTGASELIGIDAVRAVVLTEVIRRG